MLNRSRLPSYAFLDPEATRRQEEMVQQGTYDLIPSEVIWRERQPHLLERGYKLRHRYTQDWRPSWTGTNINPFYCEDSIMSMVSHAHYVSL